MFDKGMYR